MARSQEEIGEIVQSSLESILAGRETFDSILVKYPEMEDTLRPELEMAIWLSNLKGAFDPRPGHVSEARRRLVARIQQESSRRAISTQPHRQGRLSEWWRSLFPSRRISLQFAMVLLLVLSLSLFSSGAVLAAQNSVPGDPFYPVKLVQEQVQVAASFSELGQARLYIRFAERRLVEIQTLILEDRFEFIAQTVERYEEQVIQATLSLEEAAREDLEQAKALAAGLQETIARQTSVISVLIEAVPPQTRPLITHTLQISEQAVNSTQDILSQEGGSGPAVPTTTPSLTLTVTPTSGGLQAPVATLVPETALATLETGAPSSPPVSTALPAASTASSSPGAPSSTPTATAAPTNTPLPQDFSEPVREPTPTPTAEPKATKEPKPEKTKTPPGQDKTQQPPPDPPPDKAKTQEPPPSTPPGQDKTKEPPPQTPPGQDKTKEPPPNTPPGQDKTKEPPPNTPPGQDKTKEPPPQTPPGQDKTKEPPPNTPPGQDKTKEPKPTKETGPNTTQAPPANPTNQGPIPTQPPTPAPTEAP